MTRTASERQQDLASTIKHQLGTQASRRLLRSMPNFQVASDMPKHLKVLLEELENTEDQAEK